MRMFPSTLLPFNRLLETLLESSSKTADMPFRVCFHLEALRDNDVGFRLRKVLAGLLAFASPTNKNLFRALRELEDVVDKDGEAIVKGRVIATTWTEPGEDPGLLERRRSYLKSRGFTLIVSRCRSRTYMSRARGPPEGIRPRSGLPDPARPNAVSPRHPAPLPSRSPTLRSSPDRSVIPRTTR